MKTLVVTNDFPPRGGGIETFIHELLRRQDPQSIAVVAPAASSRSDGASDSEAQRYDATAGFPVVRMRAGVWPTRKMASITVRLADELGCDRVWLPSCAPHGLLVPLLQRQGLRVAVATTHGAEAGMAPYPGGRQILRAAAHADVLTYLGAWTRSQVQRALDGQRADSGWARLAPGVDLDVWQHSPEVIDKSNELRGELRLEGRPVVACVSRLVARKGQDRLISAWPTVLRQFPDAVLLLVGTGSRASQLQTQVRDLGDSIRFTGRVPYEHLPAYTALADVCALPARSRLGGLDVEGLGIVLLEAAALGIPTIATQTGGVPDALVPDATGLLLPTPTSERQQTADLADAITTLLADESLCARFGAAGRAWVRENWSWDISAKTLARLLSADS